MRRLLAQAEFYSLLTGITPLLAGVLLLAGCTHKELCFDHEDHAYTSAIKVEAEYEQEWQYFCEGGTDWEAYASWQETFGMEYNDLRPAIPEGLRVQLYKSGDLYSTSNLAALGGTVSMQPAEYSILFYNNDTEYIVFDYLPTYASARATTRTRTRATYVGNSYVDAESENTVNPPDMLYGNYIESYTAERTDEATVIPVTMHPLVFTYLIRYEFSYGLEYVALARGALAGMAESVSLSTGTTSAEAVTVLYDDCTIEPWGVQAVVRSFGIPDYPNEHYSTRSGSTYGLSLEVRLTNGNYLSFDFDISDQMQLQPQGGVIVVSGIEISDEEAAEATGGGFSVDVTDWGEYEDVDISF